MPRLIRKSTVQQQLFTVQETAVRTCRSVSSTWRDIKAGRYKVVHINGSTRITGESIDAVVAGEAPSKPSRNPNPKVKPTVARAIDAA
jgi:hypothetical protein